MRRRAARRALGTGLSVAALALGCAIDAGTVYDPIGSGRRRPPVDDPYDRGGYEDDDPGRGYPDDPGFDRAYDDGYSRGWGDREQGRSPDHTRWAGDHGRSDERSFRTGYADGYQRRPHRYGEAAPDVTPAVPDWLVGEFEGFDEAADVEVVLRVRRDGGATLVGGGRSQQGFYRNGQLELRKGTWRVQRLRGGILIAPESDPGSGVRLIRR